MWLATGHIGADLSKTFSKKSLEIVLESENLALLGVLDFGNDKTPKALDNQVESICKLACKDAHADCSASLPQPVGHSLWVSFLIWHRLRFERTSSAKRKGVRSSVFERMPLRTQSAILQKIRGAP